MERPLQGIGRWWRWLLILATLPVALCAAPASGERQVTTPWQRYQPLLLGGHLDQVEALAATDPLEATERRLLLAEVALRRGDPATARRHLIDDDRSPAAATGDDHWATWQGWMVARLARMEGDPTQARAVLQDLAGQSLPGEAGVLVALELAAVTTAAQAHGWLERAVALLLAEPATPRHQQLLLRATRQLAALGDSATGRAHELLLTLQQGLPAASPLLAPLLRQRAAIYRQAGRQQEALRLLSEATRAASHQRQSHQLLLIEFERAGLLDAGGDATATRESYRRAMAYLEAVRIDLPLLQADGSTTYSTLIEPIFHGHVAGLLRAAGEVDGAARQALLGEALEVVEALRLAELRDYFQDSCLAGKREEVTSLDPASAILHTLIISQRVELLLSLNGQLYHHTVAATRERVEQRVSRLAYSLRPGFDGSLQPFAERAAGDLYRWLIEPFSAQMTAAATATLVVVPDGALRQIPFGVLWDGERHLIERLALAVVPGLTLLDAASVQQEQMELLFAGMSLPGPVVESLPTPLVAGLRGGGAVRGLRGLAIGAATPGQPVEEPPDRGPLRTAALREMLALPGVDEELQRLGRVGRASVLSNDQFRLADFSSAVSRHPYRVVHIASHGFFGGSPEESFIMTYDRLLDMDGLESLMKGRGLGSQPIELLALSACQTAEGDERSPLGLSGVALKAGVRSAIGSLWPVSDRATLELFSHFYQRLADQRQRPTKAGALRAAQRRLIADPDFAHPFFWGPFILIGNWQ